MIVKIRSFFLFIGCVFALSSCIGTRFLKQDEYLLYSQKISGTQQSRADELQAYLRQRPNRKLLLVAFSPYIYAYQTGLKRHERTLDKQKEKLEAAKARYENLLADSNLSFRQKRIISDKRDREIDKLTRRVEEGNWLMTAVGEKPVVFDSVLIQKTAQQMNQHLWQKGFFEASVEPLYELKKKTARVNYLVSEGTPHQLRELKYISDDSVLLSKVLADSASRLVKTGQNYDESLFANERDRIARLVRDQGYYNFGRDFIYFDVDTTIGVPHRFDLSIQINTPAPGQVHKLFTISEIKIITDVGVEGDRAARDTTQYGGIKFIAYRNGYKHNILYDRISMKKGQPFSQRAAENTQRALLGGLDMYKFVNIVYDTLNGRFIPNIFASPASANEMAIEGGLSVNQALPGPFFSISLKNRNILRGFEVIELRARGTLEAQGSASQTTNFYDSQELSLNATIFFPKLLLVPISSERKQRLGVYLPRTKVTTGYTYVRRPEYSRVNFQSTLGYQWTNPKGRSFTINPVDIAIVNTPRYQDEFIEYLLRLAAGGNTLLRSFGRLFVSSMSFTYSYSDMQRKDPFYVRFFGEAGGTSLNLLGQNFLERNNTILGLEYFRFLKANAEARYYLQPSKESTLVFRGNLGAALPYGRIGENRATVLPYEKYFFTGGSNSIRAWRPRRLGPGGYTPINRETGQIDDRFEQPGELLLEMNVELRRKLFGFVNGALFVDAGNTWMLNPDSRPNSQFRVDRFYKEIAVGTGAGIRLDFSFFIMRFDLATRVYDPALPEGSRFVFGQIRSLRDIAINLGIGYPF